MRMIRRILISMMCFFSLAHAAEKPLIIGVQYFSPPFVMQSSKNKLFGFDPSMMTALCKIMNRECQFKIMEFEKLLPAVANKEIDLAASSITITPERMKLLRFSAPYLLSYSRFLARRSAVDQPFSLALLNGKNIGILKGSIFRDELSTMGIQNEAIIEYDTVNELIEGLSNDSQDIEIVLFDNPSALYWEANSSGVFVTLGKPYTYGLGLGIAVNQEDDDLLDSVNKALMAYESSADFKINYNKYINSF